MFSQVPEYGRLRPARLADLPRIGIVATASFFHSTFFPYARPFFDQYPKDTVASYRAEYREGILNPTKVVLVVLDRYKDDEVNSVYDALKGIYPAHSIERNPDAEGRIIVGVISMSLELNPARHGQFNSEGTFILQNHYQDSCPSLKASIRSLLGRTQTTVEEIHAWTLSRWFMRRSKLQRSSTLYEPNRNPISYQSPDGCQGTWKSFPWECIRHTGEMAAAMSS